MEIRGKYIKKLIDEEKEKLNEEELRLKFNKIMNKKKNVSRVNQKDWKITYLKKENPIEIKEDMLVAENIIQEKETNSKIPDLDLISNKLNEIIELLQRLKDITDGMFTCLGIIEGNPYRY